jgi:hypothetical protein
LTLATTINHARRRVHVRASDSIAFEEILAHVEHERIAAVLSYSELIDARGAHPDFSADQVRLLVLALRHLASLSPLGRTAILVDSDLAFGMLRMLEMLAGDLFAVRPFRSRPAAEAWLDEENDGTGAAPVSPKLAVGLR